MIDYSIHSLVKVHSSFYLVALSTLTSPNLSDCEKVYHSHPLQVTLQIQIPFQSPIFTVLSNYYCQFQCRLDLNIKAKGKFIFIFCLEVKLTSHLELFTILNTKIWYYVIERKKQKMILPHLNFTVGLLFSCHSIVMLNLSLKL